MDAFVHASGDGFGNTAPLRSDTGAIDMDAISQVAHVTQGAGKLTRKEKKHAKREMKRRKKEAKKAEKEAKKTYSSIKYQLKDRDKELSDKMADARKKRDSAKDVVNYIGYNKMYQDGICEVEEGMFSSSIAFDDTSYHSVRDEQQKAMFSAITRLYDQFGADTLVQMSVINTPLLKEEVGHRKFFDPERQANDAARNDAQVFNNILNDKVKEGVSNIRRNRYLTYSVTADTAEDAARQLSRIEVESSRILNSIGSKAHLMNGTQRLSVIHSLLNPYKPFLFDYQRDISAKRLQTTKDCIAPTQIDFRPDGHYNDCVKLDNGVYAQVLVMKKFGSELSDRALADMADLPIPMAITWYVQPMDKSKAINYVRTRSAWIDKEIIEEQRSAVNKGYDFSILPQELKYSKEETEDVLDHLQNKNQRLYVLSTPTRRARKRWIRRYFASSPRHVRTPLSLTPMTIASVRDLIPSSRSAITTWKSPACSPRRRFPSSCRLPRRSLTMQAATSTARTSTAATSWSATARSSPRRWASSAARPAPVRVCSPRPR